MSSLKSSLLSSMRLIALSLLGCCVVLSGVTSEPSRASAKPPRAQRDEGARGKPAKRGRLVKRKKKAKGSKKRRGERRANDQRRDRSRSGDRAQHRDKRFYDGKGERKEHRQESGSTERDPARDVAPTRGGGTVYMKPHLKPQRGSSAKRARRGRTRNAQNKVSQGYQREAARRKRIRERERRRERGRERDRERQAQKERHLQSERARRAERDQESQRRRARGREVLKPLK